MKLFVLNCVFVCCVNDDTIQAEVVVVVVVFVCWFRCTFPEDGHKRWSKLVAGYADLNTVNLHICICTFWYCYYESSFLGHEMFKKKKTVSMKGWNRVFGIRVVSVDVTTV